MGPEVGPEARDAAAAATFTGTPPSKPATQLSPGTQGGQELTAPLPSLRSEVGASAPVVPRCMASVLRPSYPPTHRSTKSSAHLFTAAPKSTYF